MLNLSIYRKLLIMVIISPVSIIMVAVIYFTQSELQTAGSLWIKTACNLLGSWGKFEQITELLIDANTLEMVLSKDEAYQRKLLDEIQEKEAETNKPIEQYKKTFLLEREKEKLAVYEENIGDWTQVRSEAIWLAQDKKGDEAYDVFSAKVVTFVRPSDHKQ
ncbi:MCP four helix bundle domain-containing protein [Priestia megaterium]|uniref:MCP four helix bundle domain-containing protein n=1 Tax=Priestia megaterium TaxID=1404 RepID=UPI00101CCA2B|nr:MCP four helix bundle domain-containing protein [Priestia megaterium]